MMQRFMSLRLKVWREACQHIEIHESIGRIASLLGEHLPVELVLVRRIEVERSCVETVGTGARGAVAGPKTRHTRLKPDELDGLLAWCRRGEVLLLPRDKGQIRRASIVPAGVKGEILVGPLSGKEGPAGVLLLVAASRASFSQLHEELAKALAEPFAVALENDRALRVMKAHQQAAEADRQSLLTKLGRQEISEAIVGADTGLRNVMERVGLVALSDVPVLLFGETGSGKEVIARAVHARSARRLGPFLRVNCGAIPGELIDSELFGHERGSFTGAVAMRKGWFERADSGTLFLDEVGELPVAAQVRLLRILQDGTFERVGGEHQLSVDVRVVAATNQDLQRMVGEGRFRDDLWYRLAVFPIHLPALRDRREDMPALAAHFALRAAKRFGLPIMVPSPEDVNRLLAYDWPGNIRELAAVIDRAAILGNGKGLALAQALGVVHFPGGAGGGARQAASSSPDSATAFPTLDAVIAEHIKAALRATSGRVEGRKGAAAILRINPHTLRARMRKLAIDWAKYRDVAPEVLPGRSVP